MTTNRLPELYSDSPYSHLMIPKRQRLPPSAVTARFVSGIQRAVHYDHHWAKPEWGKPMQSTIVCHQIWSFSTR